MSNEKPVPETKGVSVNLLAAVDLMMDRPNDFNKALEKAIHMLTE